MEYLDRYFSTALAVRSAGVALAEPVVKVPADANSGRAFSAPCRQCMHVEVILCRKI